MLGDSAFGAVQSLELSGVVVKKFLVKYENQNKALNLSSDIQSWAFTFALSTLRSTQTLNHRLYLLWQGDNLVRFECTPDLRYIHTCVEMSVIMGVITIPNRNSIRSSPEKTIGSDWGVHWMSATWMFLSSDNYTS